MERELKIITVRGSYEFGDNYQLFFKDKDFRLNDCNITCGNNCNITCGGYCKIDCGSNSNITSKDNCIITCGSNCKINCRSNCNITCGDNCKIDCWLHCYIISGNNSEIICGAICYIKTGEGSELKIYDLLKKISEDEQFIWWYNNDNWNLINTFEDEDWKNKNLDKWEKWYGFVHNELDSATLF